LQYNNDGTATLVTPDEYISMNCEYLWEINNTKTTNALQMNIDVSISHLKETYTAKLLKKSLTATQTLLTGFKEDLSQHSHMVGVGLNSPMTRFVDVRSDMRFVLHKRYIKMLYEFEKGKKTNELREILKRVGILGKKEHTRVCRLY
jgi:hypothetical protein